MKYSLDEISNAAFGSPNERRCTASIVPEIDLCGGVTISCCTRASSVAGICLLELPAARLFRPRNVHPDSTVIGLGGSVGFTCYGSCITKYLLKSG